MRTIQATGTIMQIIEDNMMFCRNEVLRMNSGIRFL